ncbi:MAG: hypothetical protein Fur002_04980 [Anaerolineales bacterium]
MSFEEEPKKQTNWGPIAAVIITALSTIFVAYINSVAPSKISIQTTQTAEAKKTVAAVLITAVEPTSAAELQPSLASPTLTPASQAEIFSTDKLTGLKPYNSVGASVAFSLVPSFSGEGLEISYVIGEGGWAGVFRMVTPESLAETKGIKFSYMGSGSSNTLEFKMEYKQGTVFSVLLPHLSASPDWQEVEVLYTDLTCWVNTPGCPENLSLSLETDKVIKIGFAVSNKIDYNDAPGTGNIVIDNVQTIR